MRDKKFHIQDPIFHEITLCGKLIQSVKLAGLSEKRICKNCLKKGQADLKEVNEIREIADSLM